MKTIALLLLPITVSLSCNAQKDPKPKNIVKTQKSVKVKQTKPKLKGTFSVDDVELATSLLGDTTYKLVLEATLDKEIYAYPESMKDQDLVPTYTHGFVNALHHSYAEHRPLELSPDAIWLLICQGFSIHLNQNYDALKKQVFKNTLPKQIYVRNDELVKGKSEDWADLIEQFTLSADSLIYDEMSALVVPKFSTTTAVTTTAYRATMLNAVKENFQFMGGSGCGIPSITLLGNVNDWQEIYDNVDKFKSYGLTEWVDALKPVLNEFLQAAKGNENNEFWKRIYKEVTVYGKYNISGWIIKFFPYFKGVEWPEYKEGMDPDDYQPTEKFYANEYLKEFDYQLCPFNSSSLPEAYARVNITWRIFDTPTTFTDKDMELYAGFLGIRQNNETKAIRPEISWAVCHKDAPSPDYFQTYRSGPNDIEHNHKEYWEPRLSTKPERMPVYHPSVNKTYMEGIDEIRHILASSGIRTNNDTQINFIVTWGGHMTQLEIESESLSTKQLEKLTKIIKRLPEKWQPASKQSRDHENGGRMVSFQLNYQVRITI